jgi:hypothetical protein
MGGYLSTTFVRPLSHYVALFTIVLFVLAYGAFFFGAAYAPIHHETIRYGPGEFFVGPIMTIAFLFYIGMRPSRLQDGQLSSILIDDVDEAHERRLQLFRMVGICGFGLGGALMGMYFVFFKWFDATNGGGSVVATASPAPRATTAAPIVFSMVPAYSLLGQVVLLSVSLILAWLTAMFQEHEQHVQQQRQSDGL